MIVNGTSSQDELYGSKDDQVFGFDGDDILDASNGEGNNLLDGGSGNDRLLGNNNDTLKGGVGADSLFALGSSGFNTLEGGEDDDELFVVEGGNNQLDGGTGSDRLTVSDGSGYNTLLGGLGNDFLNVSNGTGNNSLDGGENDDFLIGGLASDRLFGGSGDDLLFGGKKGSQLTGGTGEDRFFIASAAVPDVPIEVFDFTTGEDKVLITGIAEVQKFSDLILEQVGLDTSIKVNINGELKEFGILRNTQANILTPDDFDFVVAIFSITDASAIEGNAITFTINRTEDTQAEQQVTVSTSLTAEDTASSTDFTAKTESITFQPGETQKSFTVETTPDFLFEDNETFTVSLSNLTNEAIVNPDSSTAKGTINDDDLDIAPVFAIAPASATEGKNITFTISRTGDAQANQSVTASTSLTAEDTASSTDFTAKTETITFESGETQKSFTVEATPDFLFEDNETFTVSLSNPTNQAIVNPDSSTAKGTINDDDLAPVFAIAPASATEGKNITFTISRTGDAQANQSVTASTSLTAEDTASSTDFTAKTETITFESGETQKSFTVETTPDFLFEENETFTVSLSNPTNKAIVNPDSGIAKGTINDDDLAPVVTITQTGDSTNVTEGGTNDSYSLLLSSQPTADVTITISSGKQIKTSTQALTFTALNWNVAQNVTVTAVDDVAVEGNSSETIQHTATSNDVDYDEIAIASINVGITDNDIPLSKSADSDVFTIKGNGDKARLSIELTNHSSNQLYELGVFTVDNQQGNIGDIAPGATGYAEAAVQRAKVIFSSLANIPNGFNGNLTSLREFTSGEQIRFYLVRNNSTDSILARQAAITDILFSDPTNLKIDSLSDGSFSLVWKGQDFGVKIQTTNQQLALGTTFQGQKEGELINLQGVTQSVKADFKVNREAAFNNFVGFYKVADENGGIDINNDGKADILVGQAGYTEAAIRGRVTGIDLTVNNQGSATYTGTFGADSLFAPFMIVDGRPDAILDSNLNNDPKVYFPFLGANSDKVDHIRLLGNNIFGFEDLVNGGDQDYNDIIVQVNLTVNAA